MTNTLMYGLLALGVTLGGLYAFAPKTSAAINEQINFQGKLTNPDGTNVTNGTYSIRFRIYNHATNDAAAACAANSCLWEETQGSVSVADGNFQVALGSVNTALASSVDFNVSGLYLGIKVGSDAEMTPRVQFTAAPFAFNSNKLGGITSSGFVQLGVSAAQTDSTTNTSIFLNKTAAGNILQMQASAVDVFTVTNTGNLTFGQNAAKTISVAQRSSNAAGQDLTVAAGQGGAGASANAGGQLILQGGAGGGTNGVGGNLTLAGGAGAGSGAAGNVVVKSPGSSTTAFMVQDASNNQYLTIDTTAGDAVSVGTASNGASLSTYLSAGNQVSITANAAPTVDMMTISNTGQAVTAAGVSGLQINYVGGAAAVESSGARVDLTPGTTSGGTWNGFRVVANATGAVSGVNEYGINLDGPSSPGAGLEVAVSIDANWDAGLQIGSRTTDPASNPITDSIFVFARKIAGRSLLRQKGSSGVAVAYQPALFEQSITYQGPNTTTTVTAFGSSWTIDTTASHPAATETFGYATNFVTAATANDTAGVGEAAVQHFRGSVAGSNGFFFVSRLGLPDASYGSGATGARIYTGLTSGTIASMTNGDNPAGDYVGFQYSTNRGDTGWRVINKDNTTQPTPPTTLAIAQNKVYDFYIYVAPYSASVPTQNQTIYWRIDNITDGTTQEGSLTANLPRGNIAMRAGSGIQTLTTTARNIRVMKHYIEADR